MAEGWRDGRLKVTYRGARSVIEEQRVAIADLDGKAMYTVRVIVVLVGLFVAAAQIGGPELFHSWLLTVGLGSLLLSLCLGVVTYSESNLYIGPNRAYIRQLVDDDVDAKTWEEDVCLRMGDWIHGNDRNVRWNGGLLALTQLSLLVGVVFLVGAVVRGSVSFVELARRFASRVALRGERGTGGAWEKETRRSEADAIPGNSASGRTRVFSCCRDS